MPTESLEDSQRLSVTRRKRLRVVPTSGWVELSDGVRSNNGLDAGTRRFASTTQTCD